MTNPIKYIDIKEFRERGYLQEVNRRFFHPLGLALSIRVNEDGSEQLDNIWDYREDPEGMVFGGPSDYGLDATKADTIDKEWKAKEPVRKKMFGQAIQPVVEDLDKR